MKTRGLFGLLMLSGVTLGLAYAWLIQPPPARDVSPANVTTAYQRQWIVMAAEAFAQDGDWDRTRARLDVLRDPNLATTVAAVFDDITAHGPNAAARAVAQLADRLEARTAPMIVYLAPAETTATPTLVITPDTAAARTPEPIVTATPTRPASTPSATATPIPAHQIVRRSAECTRPPQLPQLRVIVQDGTGRGLPGQSIFIKWGAGQDRFVTGLHAELDPGYGDFEMQLDQIYNISIGKPTAGVAFGLRAEPCADDGYTSWRLIVKLAGS